jgi:hypothetical protein
MEEPINRLTDPQYDAWLNLIVETCTDPTLLGSAAHVLYIGRKR